MEKAEAVEGLEGSEIALQSYAREIYGHSFYKTASFGCTNLADDPDNVVDRCHEWPSARASENRA